MSTSHLQGSHEEPWGSSRDAGTATVQGPVGLLSTRPFSVPHCFDNRKLPSFSLHDLPWGAMGRFKQLLIMEGRGWKIREKHTVKSSLGQDPIFPIKGHTQRYLWAVGQILKPPPRGRNVNNSMPPTNMHTLGRLGLKVDVADSYLPHHQPIRRMSTSWSCPLRTITIKLLTIFPKLRHLVFRELACCVPFTW